MHAFRRFALAAFPCSLAVVMALDALDTQAPQAPPLRLARPIPGINAKDDFPGGCVDIHISRYSHQ